MSSNLSEYIHRRDSGPVALDMNQYHEWLLERGSNVLWREAISRTTEAEKLLAEQYLRSVVYPNLFSFRYALDLGDRDRIGREFAAVRHWANGNMPDPVRPLYLKWTGAVSEDVTAANRLILEVTQGHMLTVAKACRDAVNSLDEWQGSFVMVSPVTNNNPEPARLANVRVSSPTAHANFLCLAGESGVEIIEVLTNGSDEFYIDESLQEDFYNLVNAVKSPEQQYHRILTLYLREPAATEAFQSAVRNLTLYGSAAVPLPEMTIQPPEEYPFWKVRVDDSFVVEVEPGRFKPVGEDETAVRHLELVK